MATLTWLGQAGFLIESAGQRILIDPFFSEHEARTAPPPDIDVFGAHIDRMLVTHEHLDHLDPKALPAIAARSPGLSVIAPIPLADQVRDLAPVVAFVGVQPGDRHSFAGVTVFVVPPSTPCIQLTATQTVRRMARLRGSSATSCASTA